MKSIIKILKVVGWILLLNATEIISQTMSTQIMVDQFGYLPNGKKIAVFANPIQGQNNYRSPYNPGSFFRVKRASDNVRVYSNVIQTTPWSSSTHTLSGDRVWWGDFSLLTSAGDYYIEDANGKRGYTFHIGEDSFTEVLRHAGRMFFYQRCGTNIDAAHGGVWSHTACHVGANQDRAALFLTNNNIKAGTAKNVSGGWHDAGDFRKYIWMVQNVMWEMMMAAEMNRDKIPDNWNIPESGNGVPDILDEVAYELKWMLRMQGPGGGVHARVLGKTESMGNNPPGFPNYTNRRYYTEQTSWATGIFAAVMAQAARVFSQYPAYSSWVPIYLSAATNAWKYLESKPSLYPADGNDGACSTWDAGCQADAKADKRIRIWAAAELFRTTGNAKYHQYFTNNYNDVANTDDNGHHPLSGSWPHFDNSLALQLNQAFITYLLTSGAKANIVTAIRNSLANTGDWVLSNTNSSPYLCWMPDGHWVWGSSQLMARFGNLGQYCLWFGETRQRDEQMRRAVEGYAHYFHGVNPLNWIYLTKMSSANGERSVNEIYHGWFYDGTAWDTNPAPGFVPGGPNPTYSPSSGTVAPPQNQPAMKSYKDWNTGWPEDSWEVTEPGIYYQSAYVLLLSGIASAPGVSVSNFTVTPSVITNNKARTVVFQGKVTTWSGYNVTVATLDISGLGYGKVSMTNIGGGVFRYSRIIAGLNPGEYKVKMKGYNDQGVGKEVEGKLYVMPPALINVAIIYDGEPASKPFVYDYGWGTVVWSEVTNSPKHGTKILQLDMPMWGSGVAHRAYDLPGVDGSKCQYLELWMRAGEIKSNYVQVQLIDANYKGSGLCKVDARGYYWKYQFSRSELTNGAEAGFDFSKILGMVVMNNYYQNVLAYIDEVRLTAKIVVYGELANPAAADNSVATNVRFSVKAISAMTNITSVTLDLGVLGGGKVSMSNIGGWTNFRYTYKVPAGVSAGVYVLPVVAYDGKGNRAEGKIYYTALGPVPKIISILYDGESEDTDANWECWWGCPNTGVDDPTAGINGNGLNITFSAMGGGAQVPTPEWWNGVDVTRADRLQFYYKSGAAAGTFYLFSYNPIFGTLFSRAISLPATGGMIRSVSTNLSFLTQGRFSYEKVVGFYVISDAPQTMWFDDVYFTAMVEIKEEKVTPSVITNTKKNVVVFSFKSFSGNATEANSMISNAWINLKPLGGSSNTLMTNLGNKTQWRFAFTVASNMLPGRYVLSVWARDKKGYIGRSTITLSIYERPLFTTLVVYDGDTVKAEEVQQWYPEPNPPTAFFYEDGWTVPPYAGSYSGIVYVTNDATILFYVRDRTWSGIDVSSADKLEIWGRGLNGGEDITLQWTFWSAAQTMVYGRSTNLVMANTWQKWSLPFKAITNGMGVGASNISRFLGVRIDMTGKGSTVFLDEVKFAQYVKILNASVDKDMIDGDVDTVVTFSCKALTKNANITSCTLDLTQIGGTKVAMSNLSGMTDFRYSFTIKSNFLLQPGYKYCKIIAKDNGGYKDSVTVGVLIISKKEIILWDFETKNSQGFYIDLGSTSCFVPPCETSVNSNGGTNWSYTSNQRETRWPLGPVKHGEFSVGWTLKIYTNKEWIDVNTYKYGTPEQILGRLDMFNCSIARVQDFSGMRGAFFYVYVEPHKDYSAEDLYAMPFIFAPGWGEWREGQNRLLQPGQWTKLFINFDKVDNAASTYQNLTAANLTASEGIGWILNGGYAVPQGSGTKIYMDYWVQRDQLAPQAPVGLTASDGGTGGSIILSWNKAGEQDVERYEVYQNTVNNFSTAVKIAEVFTNYFVDKGVWKGTTYYYWIVAVDCSENKSTQSAVASATPTGLLPTVPFTYKGVTLDLLPSDFPCVITNVLTNMLATGANTVGVSVYWYMNTADDGGVSSNAAVTISDSDLRYVLTNIRKKRLKTFLIPKIKIGDGTLPCFINPPSKNAWLTSYSNMVFKYATIAGQYNVNLFSVGHDLNSVAFSNNQLARWNGIISMARQKVGTNKLTFNARAAVTNGTLTWYTRWVTYRAVNQCIWNNPNIDYIGINADFPLDDARSPYTTLPLSRLYDAWDATWITNDAEGNTPPLSMHGYYLNLKWQKNFEEWKSFNQPSKPVLFTEINYASMDYAARKPSKENIAAYGVNETIQRDLYEALFRRWWDKPYMDGTFFGGWKPVAPATPNKLFTPQNKPAYNVIKEWYSIRPHHFAIQHNGGGEAGTWIPVIITPHLVDHTPVPTYLGVVTLSVDKGTALSVSWTNISGCGTFQKLAGGKAVFTFSAACQGVVTLGVKDNTRETLNIGCKNGFITDIPEEDENLVITGPLKNFWVIHSGYGIKNYPVQITVQAMDVATNVKINYVGTISLFARNAKGNIRWALDNMTNSTFMTSNGRAIVTFRLSEAGVMKFKMWDDTAETVDVEAKTVSGSHSDADLYDPLIIVDFDHFAVVHDGSALIGFDEPVTIRAEDISGNPVYGVLGIITIFFHPSKIPSSTNFSLTLTSGNGTLTKIKSNRWIYSMQPQDGGVFSFLLYPPVAATLDIEATEGLHQDNDQYPQWLVVQTHIYHYVRKNNPSPSAPYATPETAATNIMQAMAMTSPGDTVLILDNAVYPRITIQAGAPGRINITYAGIETNMPTIFADGVPAIEVIDSYNWAYPLVFKNLKIVANNAACRYSGPSSGTFTNIFIHCIFSNTGNTPALQSANTVDLNVYYCEFKGNTAADAINSGWFYATNYCVGNIFRNYNNPVYYMGPDVIFYGNIVIGGAGGALQTGTCADAQYNTCYGASGDALAGVTYRNTYNNIVMNNGGTGIGGAAGTHDYNHAYNNGVNFSTALGANDVVQNPLFVNPATGDFRLRVDSPCLFTANGSIRGSRGAYNWSVKVAEKNVNTVTTYTLIWVPFRPLPPAGVFKFVFPGGTDCSGVTGISSTISGGFNWSGSGSNLIVMRDGTGTTIQPLQTQRLIISGIKNPNFAGSFYSVLASTREGNPLRQEGDTLEFPRLSNCYEIIASDLKLILHKPPVNAKGLSLNTGVTCTFNTNLLPATVTSNTVFLQNSGWQKVPVNFSFLDSNKKLILTPQGTLEANEKHTVTITKGVMNILGGTLTSVTQFSFWTTTGNTTPHIYRTNKMDGQLTGYDIGNIVATNIETGWVGERLVSDNPPYKMSSSMQIWATWSSNKLYMAVVKSNSASAAGSWYDYILIDTSRDDKGATNNPPLNINPGYVNLRYEANRRPEFIIIANHSPSGSPASWQATNYKWTGTGWQKQGLRKTAPLDYTRMPTTGFIEFNLSWTNSFMFNGNVPNRISIAVFSVSNSGTILDRCPDNWNLGTNWVTIDPDNDGNQIPDFMRVMAGFTIWHDGIAAPNVWETFTVTCLDDHGGVYSNYTGTITIDSTTVPMANIRFTNGDGLGTFTVLPDNRAVYQFTVSDGGVVNFKIKGLVAGDYIKIRVRSVSESFTNISSDLWVVPPASLSMKKSASVSSVSVGGEITYRIEVSNKGPGTAWDVCVIDQIPDGAGYVSGSLRMGGKTNQYGSSIVLSDSTGNDEGCYESSLNRVTFSGPGGSAPASGAMAEGDVRAYFFKVKVMSNSLQPIVNVAELNAIYSTNIVLVFTGTVMSVRKSITNITLKGSISPAIPGATVNYRIVCSNKTGVKATNVVVYDKIDRNYLEFVSGSASGTGWTIEYSTNENPNQDYVSPDYGALPAEAWRVRWIRWKRGSMPGNSESVLRYNVRIR